MYFQKSIVISVFLRKPPRRKKVDQVSTSSHNNKVSDIHVSILFVYELRPGPSLSSKSLETYLESMVFSNAIRGLALRAPRRIVVPRQVLRHSLHPRRTVISAPGPNSGPLLSRSADRELPSIAPKRRWLRSIPIFVVVIGASLLGIFNYQKSSSSVVNSTLYALRTSSKAREILGDEIYFAHKMPWIYGEMNQLHGRIDINFWVKGTKSTGRMRFRSIKPSRTSLVSSALTMPSSESFFSPLLQYHHEGVYIPLLISVLELQFKTEEWSLQTEDGKVIQLLDESSGDPFNKEA